MGIILNNTKVLFLPIKKALKGETPITGLGKISEFRAALLNLATMVTSLSAQPTHVKELIPKEDHYYRYYDACVTGAGGVWFNGTIQLNPFVWRVEFDKATEIEVVSEHNPQSCLTNSYLEMAAVILKNLVLHKEVDMKFARSGVLSDNTPTVEWLIRMADKAQLNTAGSLLRGLTSLPRASQVGPLTVASIAGVENSMDDVASHSFGKTAYLILCFYHCSSLLYPYHRNNLGDMCDLRPSRYCSWT